MGKMMFNKGLSSLQSLIIVIGLLVLVVIVSPMVTLKSKELRGRSKDKILALIYFGALGVGFINVEIALMQKFILLLGHPIYAFSVVLFSVLIFSGLGSRYTGRWSATSAAKTIKFPLAILYAISILYLAVLGPVIYSLFHLPEIIRIILAVLMLAPLSFMMGMPLPLGIKYLSHNFEKMIPWAWAVNGSLSVLGSAFAFYFAIIQGFNFVIFLGSCFYVLALIVSLFFVRSDDTLSKDESQT